MKKIRQIFMAVVMMLLIMVMIPSNAKAANTTVKLSNQTMTIYVGGSSTLKMTGTAKTVKWTSSKKSVATVSSKGVVTGKKAGTAVITAKSGSKKATCTVTVKKQLSTAKTVAKVNKQIEKARYFNFTAYSGKVKAVNYQFKYGLDVKKKIQLVDTSALGLVKAYYYKNKMYWYSTSAKKWYYQKSKNSSKFQYNNKIESNMKCSLDGTAKFNGKKCAVLKVISGDETTLYYLDLANYEWIGMYSDGFNVKVDLKKPVKISSKALKAKKKTFTF